MIQIKKTSFKGLRKLSIGERIKAVNNPNVGSFLFSALTPTQYAELFPRYYRDQVPDVGLLALPSSASRMRQAAEADQRVQQAAEGSDTGILGKIKQKLGLGKTALISKPGITAPPQLSPEDLMTYNAIKNQPLAADDPRTKFLSGLSEDQLKAGGLQKYTDEQTGKEMFKYVAPQVTEQEAVEKLKTSGTGDNRFFSAIIQAEGTAKHGDPYNTSLGYMQSPKPLTEMTMAEALAWGDHVRQSQGLNSSAKGAFQIVNTTQKDAMRSLGIGMEEKFSPENQRRMAAWIAKQQGLGAWEGFKVHPDMRNVASSAMQEGLHNQYGERALGPQGQYTPEQITSSMERLRAERAKGQIQSLAEATYSQMGAPGAPGTGTNVPTDKLATISSYRSAGKGYCGIGTRYAARDLFGDGYFNKGLGEGGSPQASSLSRNNNYFQNSGYYNPRQSISKQQALDPNYLNSLPIGTVMSAQGGNANGDGHVQIKLGPNRWVSYFDQNGVLGQRRDGRQYDGYAVHMPNESGLKKIQEQGFATHVTPTAPPPEKPTVEDAHDVSQTDSSADISLDAPPKAKVDIVPGGVPDFMQTPGAPPVQQPVPTEPGAPVPQAAPEPAKKAEAPKPQPSSYKVNQAKLIAAIKNTDEFKNTFGSSFATDSMIVEGFANDSRVCAAGVSYDPATGVMKFKDPNDPRVKEALAGLDSKKFMTPIEEKKKEEPKKPEVPPEIKPQQQTSAPGPTPAPQPQQAPLPAPPSAPQQASPTPAPASPKPGEPAPAVKVEIKPTTPQPQQSAPTAQSAPATPQISPPAPPKQEPPKVPSRADGGEVKVKGEVAAYPINGLRGDNSLVIDTKTQQPLFTMNPTREAMVPTPENNRANIVPTDKVNPQDVAKPPVSATDQITKDLQALRSEVGNAFDKLTTGEPENKASPKGAPQHRDPDMIGTLLQRTKIPYSNPTAMRAFSRARFNETGEAVSDFHHSTGNSNTV